MDITIMNVVDTMILNQLENKSLLCRNQIRLESILRYALQRSWCCRDHQSDREPTGVTFTSDAWTHQVLLVFLCAGLLCAACRRNRVNYNTIVTVESNRGISMVQGYPRTLKNSDNIWKWHSVSFSLPYTHTSLERILTVFPSGPLE